MRVQLGIGIIIAALVPIALLLFNVLKPYGTLSAILLLAGLWILVFGVTYGAKIDRIYNVSMGLIIAILSSFYFIPLRYTFGLIIVAVIAMIVVSLFARPKATSGRMGAQNQMPSSAST